MLRLDAARSQASKPGTPTTDALLYYYLILILVSALSVLHFKGIRGSGARCAEAGAIKTTPAKVFSYVNRQHVNIFTFDRRGDSEYTHKWTKRERDTHTYRSRQRET